LGEQRTHSMLSHGPGQSVTHAAMKIPDQNSWPKACGLPLNEGQLQYGWPGLETVNQGAIYGFLYGGAGSEWVAFQSGDPVRQAAIAQAVESMQTASEQNFSRPMWNGGVVPYSLFQYRDLEQSNLVPGGSANNGMVCSTFLAHAHAAGGQGVIQPLVYGS